MFTARVADDALVDIQLVGDSLANVVMGELSKICYSGCFPQTLTSSLLVWCAVGCYCISLLHECRGAQDDSC